MKKIILSIFVFSLLSAPLISLHGEDIGTIVTIPGGSGDNVLSDILTVGMTLSNWLFSILLVVGVIGIVIAGFLFITSSADAAKVKQARDVVIYSLVGVLVGSLGIVLVNWARNIVTSSE